MKRWINPGCVVAAIFLLQIALYITWLYTFDDLRAFLNNVLIIFGLSKVQQSSTHMIKLCRVAPQTSSIG